MLVAESFLAMLSDIYDARERRQSEPERPARGPGPGTGAHAATVGRCRQISRRNAVGRRQQIVWPLNR